MKSQTWNGKCLEVPTSHHIVGAMCSFHLKMCVRMPVCFHYRKWQRFRTINANALTGLFYVLYIHAYMQACEIWVWRKNGMEICLRTATRYAILRNCDGRKRYIIISFFLQVFRWFVKWNCAAVVVAVFQYKRWSALISHHKSWFLHKSIWIFLFFKSMEKFWAQKRVIQWICNGGS